MPADVRHESETPQRRDWRLLNQGYELSATSWKSCGREEMMRLMARTYTATVTREGSAWLAQCHCYDRCRMTFRSETLDA